MKAQRVTLTSVIDEGACLQCTRPAKWIVGDPKAKRGACGLHVDAIASSVAIMEPER